MVSQIFIIVKKETDRAGRGPGGSMCIITFHLFEISDFRENC